MSPPTMFFLSSWVGTFDIYSTLCLDLLPEWLSSCILTVLRFPLIANLIFSWKTGRDSGVGGGVEGINRGKVSLLSISHLPKCLYSLLVYTHRIKRLEG